MAITAKPQYKASSESAQCSVWGLKWNGRMYKYDVDQDNTSAATPTSPASFPLVFDCLRCQMFLRAGRPDASPAHFLCCLSWGPICSDGSDATRCICAIEANEKQTWQLQDNDHAKKKQQLFAWSFAWEEFSPSWAMRWSMRYSNRLMTYRPHHSHETRICIGRLGKCFPGHWADKGAFFFFFFRGSLFSVSLFRLCGGCRGVRINCRLLYLNILNSNIRAPLL